VVLRRRFTLLCLAVALCAGAVSPASALSAERVVRPVQTYALDSGWSVTPASAQAHDALADAVTDPAAPDTTTGYLATAKTGAVAEAGFAAPAITTGETVTGTRLHTYFETGSNRSLFVELRSGASLLGWTIVPAGQGAGWHDVGA